MPTSAGRRGLDRGARRLGGARPRDPVARAHCRERVRQPRGTCRDRGADVRLVPPGLRGVRRGPRRGADARAPPRPRGDGRGGEGLQARIRLRPEQPDRGRAGAGGVGPVPRRAAEGCLVAADEAYADYLAPPAAGTDTRCRIRPPGRGVAHVLQVVRPRRAAARVRHRPPGARPVPRRRTGAVQLEPAGAGSGDGVSL